MPKMLGWSPDQICLRPTSIDVERVAIDVYDRTCRFDFKAPGFCVLNVGSETNTHAFRQLMVHLKQAMGAIHHVRSGNDLAYLSAARFDQQQSTKPHLDSGPEECFLMLGYEPSEVDSLLEISDYAKCAFDLRLTPREFLTQHNPMFQNGYELLRPYSTRIPCFSQTDHQIICINNSSAPFSPEHPAWQGTLHTATISNPDETKRRVINSTMIASVSHGAPEEITKSQQQEFVESTVVRRRGYDKTHLNDDS